jgi:hypothetical protein
MTDRPEELVERLGAASYSLGYAFAREDDFDIRLHAKELMQVADEVATALERAQKACNICDSPWPLHTDACAYKRTAYKFMDAQAALERAGERERALEEALRDQRRRWNRHSTRLTMAAVKASHRDMDDAVDAIDRALDNSDQAGISPLDGLEYDGQQPEEISPDQEQR